MSEILFSGARIAKVRYWRLNGPGSSSSRMRTFLPCFSFSSAPNPAALQRTTRKQDPLVECPGNTGARRPNATRDGLALGSSRLLCTRGSDTESLLSDDVSEEHGAKCKDTILYIRATLT
eukprot:8953210-Pyramimonas_sp.AAC.1